MPRFPVVIVFLYVLTLCPQAHAGFSWESGFLISPDGTQLAYSTKGPPAEAVPPYNILLDSANVWVCDPDGANSRLIGNVPTFGEAFWFDADHIAVASSHDDRRYYILTLTGERREDLVLPMGCDVLYKRLSPDRRLVAYVGAYHDKGKKIHGVFNVDLATQSVIPVLIGAHKTAPSWSPDSTRLAIGNGEGYVAYHELLIIDLLSGHVANTGVKGVGAAWSARGRHLTFTTEVIAPGSWQRGVPVAGRVGVLDTVDGSAYSMTPSARYLKFDDGTRQEMSGALGPEWSPDARWIAYRERSTSRKSPRTGPETKTGIFVVDTRSLTSFELYGEDARYAWSPDGRALYVLTEESILRAIPPTFEVEPIVSWTDLSVDLD